MGRKCLPLILIVSLLAGSCTLPAPRVSEKEPEIAITEPALPLAPFETPPLQVHTPVITADRAGTQATATMPPAPVQPTSAQETAAPLQPSPTAIETRLPPIPEQITVWVDPRLPRQLLEKLQTLPAGMVPAATPEAANIRLEIGPHYPVITWVYALATAFPSTNQGASLVEVLNAWRGLSRQTILVDDNTLQVFSVLWGPAAPTNVAVMPRDQLLDAAWKDRSAWALLPFEDLSPRWKVLEVAGQSPLHKDFDLANYPLTVLISIAANRPVEGLLYLLPATNYLPSLLTTLAMTGVTALVRATAFTMDQQGVLYPDRDIRDWLREADLTHISNEVPFARNCPPPDPVQRGVVFCSDPSYIALLEDIGTDIVELTGDHFADWGTDAMLLTLEMYRQRGWKYYGGGANLQEGRQPLLVEHNGNKLAFIGCNAKGPAFAHASATNPGAVTCDFDYMEKEISRLRSEGYLVIATFQHFEYYTYAAQPNQEADSRRLAEAGAVIVSGSQAHQPQAIEFWGDAFIHYGLGNLFFDQYAISLPTRQGFIDRHVFYNGRYIGVELLPILFVDFARPRPMTADERNDLLEAVFSASGW